MLVFFVFCIFFSLPKISSENPPFSLSGKMLALTCYKRLNPGVIDAFWEQPE
jgi:hypothetical protein